MKVAPMSASSRAIQESISSRARVLENKKPPFYPLNYGDIWF
jgi:hypothetical protein